MVNPKKPKRLVQNTSCENLKHSSKSTVAKYLEENRQLLQRRESARESEYAVAKSLAARVVIKSDMGPSPYYLAVAKKFAQELVKISSLSEHWQSEEDGVEEILDICADYIVPTEEPEQPASAIYKDEEGKVISLKIQNFVANFSFRSFCVGLGKAIALKISIGSFEGNLDSILGLIVAVVETLVCLSNQSKYELSEDEVFFLRQLIIETSAGRFVVSEEQLINMLIQEGKQDRDKYIELVNKFDAYKIISIDNGMISLKEKIYF